MPDAKAFSNLTSRLADRLQGRDNNNHSVRILTLIEKLERQASALDQVRAAKNPIDTAAAHARKVAKAAKRLRAESDRIDGLINEIVTIGYREIGELMEAQTGLVQGDYSAEIRASFRGMTEKQRSDTILTAMSEGNSEVIAAVSLSPAILSGLDPNVQERSVEAIRQMKCPELIEESDDLSEALQTASAAKELAGIMFSENYDHAEQTAIDQAELDAASAESELTESIRESVCG
jgi:broad specificity phosphatase PhoE